MFDDAYEMSPTEAYRHWEEFRKIKAENAQLRELVKDMWQDIPKSESCGWDVNINCCIGSDECIGECSYWYRMRELGVEVDDDN